MTSLRRGTQQPVQLCHVTCCKKIWVSEESSFCEMERGARRFKMTTVNQTSEFVSVGKEGGKWWPKKIWQILMHSCELPHGRRTAVKTRIQKKILRPKMLAEPPKKVLSISLFFLWLVWYKVDSAYKNLPPLDQSKVLFLNPRLNYLILEPQDFFCSQEPGFISVLVLPCVLANGVRCNGSSKVHAAQFPGCFFCSNCRSVGRLYGQGTPKLLCSFFSLCLSFIPPTVFLRMRQQRRTAAAPEVEIDFKDDDDDDSSPTPGVGEWTHVFSGEGGGRQKKKLD